MTLHKMKVKIYLGLSYNVADLVSHRFKTSERLLYTVD
jgi:hypothetical protein